MKNLNHLLKATLVGYLLADSGNVEITEADILAEHGDAIDTFLEGFVGAEYQRTEEANSHIPSRYVTLQVEIKDPDMVTNNPVEVSPSMCLSLSQALGIMGATSVLTNVGDYSVMYTIIRSKIKDLDSTLQLLAACEADPDGVDVMQYGLEAATLAEQLGLVNINDDNEATLQQLGRNLFNDYRTFPENYKTETFGEVAFPHLAEG